MTRKITKEFQWLFHLAILRRVIKDHPEGFTAALEEMAKDIASRMADDFCARFLIYEKIKKCDIEKYLKTFVQFYFENEFTVSHGEIKAAGSILGSQNSPGIHLFREIFQGVFNVLNGDVVFKSLEDKITFTAVERE